MKVTIEKQEPERLIKTISDMLPGEIGVMVSDFKGQVVMRTFSSGHFEVINLSHPGVNKCWTCSSGYMVEIYHNAELKVILK